MRDLSVKKKRVKIKGNTFITLAFLHRTQDNELKITIQSNLNMQTFKQKAVTTKMLMVNWVKYCDM